MNNNEPSQKSNFRRKSFKVSWVAGIFAVIIAMILVKIPDIKYGVNNILAPALIGIAINGLLLLIFISNVLASM